MSLNRLWVKRDAVCPVVIAPGSGDAEEHNSAGQRPSGAHVPVRGDRQSLGEGTVNRGKCWEERRPSEGMGNAWGGGCSRFGAQL